MDVSQFEQIVVEVLDNLPPEFAVYLENVEVMVAQRPTDDQRRRLGVQSGQTVYGMYEGVPLTRRSSHMLYSLPDTIVIFQESIERHFHTDTALRHQIRRTVLHEIAHVFGISDARLHELGAY